MTKTTLLDAAFKRAAKYWMDDAFRTQGTPHSIEELTLMARDAYLRQQGKCADTGVLLPGPASGVSGSAPMGMKVGRIDVSKPWSAANLKWFYNSPSEPKRERVNRRVQAAVEFLISLGYTVTPPIPT